MLHYTSESHVLINLWFLIFLVSILQASRANRSSLDQWALSNALCKERRAKNGTEGLPLRYMVGNLIGWMDDERQMVPLIVVLLLFRISRSVSRSLSYMFVFSPARICVIQMMSRFPSCMPSAALVLAFVSVWNVSVQNTEVFISVLVL